VHIAGHAVAKALGFYAATPLLAHEPRAAGHAVTGIARTQPGLGATMGISLGALAGLPPSPLFLSEILVIAGGFEAGRGWAAAGTAVLLALGFVGLAHALVETTGGRPRRRDRSNAPGLRPVVVLGGVSTVILLALAAAAFWLPDTDIVEALARGVG
jgi:hydrogenase-4 component F